MRFLTNKIEENTSDTIISFIYEDTRVKSDVFDYLNNLSNGELAKQIYEYKTIKGSLGEIFKYSVSKDLIHADLQEKMQEYSKDLSLEIHFLNSYI